MKVSKKRISRLSLTLLCSFFLLLVDAMEAQNWQVNGALEQNRFRHVTILLNDGRLLIIGGTEERRMPSLNHCEVFDYRDNSSYTTESMKYPRQNFAGILLDDGRVLVAGGALRKFENYLGEPSNSAEIYDPQSERWIETDAMAFNRESFSMVKLSDGRVMVFGGVGDQAGGEGWNVLNSCEIYDPQSESWSLAAPMASARSAYSVDLLDNGLVMIAGGYGAGGDSYQVYDPQTDTWLVNSPLLEARSGEHGAIKLPDGRILRAGGWPGPSVISEIYDPMDDSWRTTLGDLQEARYANLMTLLPDGRVMTLGGHDAIGSSISSVEIFDLRTESWSFGADPLPIGLAHYTLTRLPNGQSVVIGGVRMAEREVVEYNADILISNFPTLENSSKIVGRVWRDINADCEENAGDHAGAETLIRIEPGSHLVLTDADGCYETLLLPGDYSMQLVGQNAWQQTCPPEVLNFSVQAAGEVIEDVNLGATPRAAYSDLHVSVAGTRARPGFEQRYFLRYQNRGTQAFNGQLCFNYKSSLLGYTESIPAAERVEEERLVWNLQNIAADESGVIEVFFRIPPDEELIGTELCVDVLAKDDKRSDVLLHERDEECIEITGSHDPNDLAVFPAGTGELGLVSKDITELTYVARFQNNGNDTAFTVRLLDTLDRYHAAGSIRLGAASHPFKLNLINGRILEFVFSDIKLPYADQDLAGSQGFVKYYISREAEIPDGTTLDNQVAIYFDFNKPIFTNTVLTTFDSSITHVPLALAAQFELEVFPNPARQSANVGFEPESEITSIEVIDVMGRLLQHVAVDPGTQSSSVNVETLPVGSYRIIGRDAQGTALAGHSLSVQR